MAQAHPSLPTVSRRGFAETARVDSWWLKPLGVLLGLGGFGAYLTWAAFQGAHYRSGPYLSPLYSPELWGNPVHAWLGPQPAWWPGWLPWSPAFLVLWAPGGFRLTCYYYRGAYYKAFWADPPACAVGEPRRGYLGEAAFPLILQNVHRYFLYLALLFLPILSHDVWQALWFPTPSGGSRFGIGVGTLVLALNAFLLGGYTLSCHSLRHLIGGGLDRLSERPLRQAGHACVSCLNRWHPLWAWLSLVWVCFSDVYVRLCAAGIWSDWRIL